MYTAINKKFPNLSTIWDREGQFIFLPSGNTITTSSSLPVVTTPYACNTCFIILSAQTTTLAIKINITGTNGYVRTFNLTDLISGVSYILMVKTITWGGLERATYGALLECLK